MQFELAPMEGITGYLFRNAYHRHYLPMDRYFTPFLSPKTGGGISSKEHGDCVPANNEALPLIPQILTKDAALFLQTADWLKSLGYTEINLNLGCPAPTVVTKGKGSAQLKDKDALRTFLDKLCNGLSSRGMRLSIKTRLGFSSPDEFPALLSIFNQYPLTELIIHPRVREEYYLGIPHLDAFASALSTSACPVSYNGNLFGLRDLDSLFHALSDGKKQPSALMLGRGLLAAPWLTERLSAALSQKDTREEAKSGAVKEAAACAQVSPHDAVFEKKRLRAFHDDILAGYTALLYGDQAPLSKTKELWTYWILPFSADASSVPDSSRSDSSKLYKQLKKTKHLQDYKVIVDEIFRSLDFDADYCDHVRGLSGQPLS